jgi:hypothetical protein
MNRSLLILGLLIMLAGFFFLYQGVQILTPLAELTGLASQVQTERSIVPSTLLTVPASNYNYLTANLQGGISVKGTLQVGNGQEIAMYVMDEGNFAQWQTSHRGEVLLAKPMAISYNFTIVPRATGTYYFIFDNQDTTKRVVILSLSVLENRTVISPIIENAGYEIFALGIIFFGVGVKTGKQKPKPQKTPEADVRIRGHPAGMGCRFCGAAIATGQTFCPKCGRAQK